MAHKSKLLLPNSREIRQLLDGKGWNIDEFCRQAGNINDRTALKILWGDGVVLAKKLALVANALQVPIEQIIRDGSAGEPKWPIYSRVQVCENWGRSWAALKSAKKSILIIDSYFGEYYRLGLDLKQAIDPRDEPLKLDIYMASPDWDFGAQRMREMKLKDDGTINLFSSLEPQISSQDLDSYEKDFHTYADGIKEELKELKERRIIDSIFEYNCMPSLRFVVIDDINYYFGWFPLADSNPRHPCLFLKDDGLNIADSKLLSRLKAQISRVKRLSVPALEKSKRLRPNRRVDAK